MLNAFGGESFIDTISESGLPASKSFVKVAVTVNRGSKEERGISPMIPKRQRAAALQDASRTADANDDSRFTVLHAHAPCSAIMSGDDYEYD